MDTNYQARTFAYQPCAEQHAPQPGADAHPTHPVVVIGAGPVGLAAAIDLAQRGVPVVLLDDDCTLSAGSRAICFAKRTLDIFDRLGCGQRMVDKGVSWNVGKIFFDRDLVYSFDLMPESGHHRPAFINLQQYYVEGFLVERAAELANLSVRWRHRVAGLAQDAGAVTLDVETPDGNYALRARYVVVADGARSPVRHAMGLESKGRVFKDRFLIADVKMAAPFPSERWFWFDPPFNRNQSVLVHRQPDNVWRIDFQLGWDADPDLEKQPERVTPRIRALLGEDVAFTLEWVSVYTFSCQRMDSFRHGRVLFAGDAAHRVSPFGARGANSGVQDAENLAWKLALVLSGNAPDALLDSYASEREYAADENIRNSTRSTDFITPKTPASRVFRDAVLILARHHAFARQLVNSGRLSVPAVLAGSVLNTPDGPDATGEGMFAGQMVPGAPCADAPVRAQGQAAWLLGQLGERFTAMVFAGPGGLPVPLLTDLLGLASAATPLRVLCVTPAGKGGATAAHPAPAGVSLIEDSEGLLARRYDGRPGTAYLLRPDQHVCARWRSCDPGRVGAALRRALGWEQGSGGVAGVAAGATAAAIA
ncbi:FAD-dependent oxidoreductase [Cupriavidus basilensis]|uniref:FAD-dependent oxidoreductase n=1 Tax=Cupriavidus basilensis TaxID=68895 RepID=A0ABT6AYS3_9BURK|nr:FAD-dependent oxidoreductase [Cupriavidus basilensis]MDF3837417.1 FAD-dependent oxidoreductase [Cupriavidus basilensis]